LENSKNLFGGRRHDGGASRRHGRPADIRRSGELDGAMDARLHMAGKLQERLNIGMHDSGGVLPTAGVNARREVAPPTWLRTCGDPCRLLPSSGSPPVGERLPYLASIFLIWLWPNRACGAPPEVLNLDHITLHTPSNTIIHLDMSKGIFTSCCPKPLGC
jgi:hypothetical protein